MSVKITEPRVDFVRETRAALNVASVPRRLPGYNPRMVLYGKKIA